jgi:hypothetical protein
MTVFIRGIRLASLALVVAGCAENLVVREQPETPPFENDRATVTGHVVDADGAAMPGATVTVRSTGERATVDSSGAFVIDVPANTTLTLAATAPNMATTLVPQFMISPDSSAAFTIPLLTGARIASLGTLGPNPTGGVVAIAVKSVSGAPVPGGSVTIELTPSTFGKVLYAPETAGIPDPDPSLTAIGAGDDCIAWALGVQPHVSIMTLTLSGVSQVEPPYSIDDVTWPGTFTVEAGALTLVTLLTP